MTVGQRIGTVAVLLAGALVAHSGAAWAQQPPGIDLGPHISSGVPGPGAIDNSCAGGEIYDDGVPENGYSGNPDTVKSFEIVQRFNPSSLARVYVMACVSLLSLGGTDHLDFELVVYADDAGQPGAQLGATPVSASGLPNNLPGAWYSFDLTGIPAFTTNAPVFIGTRHSPAAFPSRFILADQSEATPLHPSFLNFNLGGGWAPVQNNFPNYRAMLIRVVPSVPVPTLSEIAFVTTLVLLMAVAFYGLRRRHDGPALQS